MSAAERTTLQVYRDCLRLVKHMAGVQSGKAATLRAVVRTQFRANKFETNPELAKQLRERAERALSQYLFYERTRSDPKFKAHLQDQAATAMAGEGASPEARAAAGKQAALDLTAMTGVDRGSIQSFIEAEQETLAGASPDQVAELIAAGALTPDYGDEDAEEGEGEWDPYADDDDEEEGGGGHLDLDADVAQFVLDAKQRDALLAADAEAAAQRK